MNRREFLETSAAVGSAAIGRGASRDFELAEFTIDQLQQGLTSGRFTARHLASLYLERIQKIDRAGPSLNAIIELNPDALAIAADLDTERKNKSVRGPLHGIPVLLKDNIDTADRMMTTAGSLALAGASAPKDSSVAAQLRAAGAVILGKTNLSEWANFRSSHSVSGWSGRGGQTKNPYSLDRNPSGSSSGSAAAVSANLCAVAVGTETDGSIVSPASINGLVGIKPTVGLISRAGIVPISHSQDTAGPMARTVRDAAILLSAMTVPSGGDPRDPATYAASGKVEKDYTKFLDSDGLKGARLGVARRFLGSNPRVDVVIERCLKDMQKAGAEVVDTDDLPNFSQVYGGENEVLLYEFRNDLNTYLKARGNTVQVHSLADVIAFNQREQTREMPWFGQDQMIKAEEKGTLFEKPYLDALHKCQRLSRQEGIDALLEKGHLHAIVAATGGLPWLTDWANGDADTGSCSTLAAVAGYPHITVPAGLVYGLPVGLSFFGAAWSEPVLIRLAYAFEQITKARRAPEFRTTTTFTQT